jgi:hypothetical protein
MAIVMSNGDGIFRAQINKRNWAGKFHNGDGCRSLPPDRARGDCRSVCFRCIGFDRVQAAAERSEKMVLNPVVR